MSPATINFEMTILRTCYYLICERGISMDNPCARFKPLLSEKERLKGRPPVYKQAELDKISPSAPTPTGQSLRHSS